MELILTGRVIDAEEALRIGLANEVCPKGDGLPRALALAHAIAALPQPALRSDKEAAVRGYGVDLPTGLMLEAQCFNRTIGGPVTREGVRRFRERDHPDRGAGTAPVTPGLVRSGAATRLA